ncbi:MAG: type II toxin-antitoxin system HipA family toxin [Gammaproteobacteria bacterium]|nr:MAG: type II toxin-antitoxin system HipA family toxin [Gammaproteobacteria bacterium]
MARPRTRIPLNVYLNARLVGKIRRQSSGAIDFRYDPAWLAWEHALPVSLSLPLREDRYTGDRVIAVLDNLLPDNHAIRRQIAERLRAGGSDAYSLLAKVGRDCVGALQFLPEGTEPGTPGVIDAREASETEIARKLANLASAPLGIEEDEDFRISIAGAQEKTALLFWKNRWYIPHGTTPTTHILKPQIGELPSGIDLSRSVENEYLCLKLTQAFDLPSAQVEIADFDSHRALVVERFDRRWTRDDRLIRLPQEDCCQALSIHPDLKYQKDGGPGMSEILGLLQASDEPEADRRMFIKAQILFWLLGATDGHAKNFSLFLQPGGRFQMTPLYDVMSAQCAIDAHQLTWNQMKLAIAVGNNNHYRVNTILPRHFEQTAARNGISAAVIEQLFTEITARAESAIEDTLTALPENFPADIAESITGGLRNRLRTFAHIPA